MNIQTFLTNWFEHEQTASDKLAIKKLEQAILSETVYKRHHPWRRFAVPAVLFLAVFVFIGYQFYPQQSAEAPIRPAFIQPVSAKEVLANMKTSIDSVTRIHYKIRSTVTTKDGKTIYSVELPDGSSSGLAVDNNDVKEYWYDFKSGDSRFESLSNHNWVSAIVEKKLGKNERIVYDFRRATTSDENGRHPTNSGIFWKMHWTEEIATTFPSDGLSGPAINTNVNPREQFENIIKNFEQNKPKLETISQNSKEYYKLAINFPYSNKEAVIQQTGYTLLIEKNTYRPYKEIKIYNDGAATVEYSYEDVSTDFSDEIFGPVPPTGYSLLTGGVFTISSDYEPTLMGCTSSMITITYKKLYDSVCPEGVVGIYEIINADFVKGKEVAELAGHGFPGLFGRIATYGLELDYDFKLYRSKDEFETREAAKNAKDVNYIELKKSVAGFQETVTPTTGKYLRFKLELIDKQSGKKLKEIILVPDGVPLRNEIG